MNPWFEFLLALLLSSVALILGLRAKRLRWVLMLLGVAGVGLSLIAANDLPRSSNGYLLSAAIPLVTAALLRCEISRVTRTGLAGATLAATMYSGWMEFLGPALSRPALARLTTKLDQNGICRQTTGYTCGPAAAVTALRRIGFSAEEGDLALLAHCSLLTGTDPSDLAAAIGRRFGPTGARAESRPMETLAQLAQAGLALTVIKLEGNLDHWVAVLEMDEHEVHFADPVQGLRVQSRADFERVWEHETIRIWRDKTGRKS